MAQLNIALLVANMMLWVYLAKHVFVSLRTTPDTSKTGVRMLALISACYLILGFLWILMAEFSLVAVMRSTPSSSMIIKPLAQQGGVILFHLGALFLFWRWRYPLQKAQ